MLITLLILQILLTQHLTQMHQQVLAQMEPSFHGLPVYTNVYLKSCLQGHCDEKVEDWALSLLFKSQERQFYSAQFKICESNRCYSIEHIISAESAILKEGYKIHAVGAS